MSSDSWSVARGDPTYVFVLGVAKPINCGSKHRAMLISAAPDFHAAATLAIAELEAVEREIGIPSKALPLLRAAVAKSEGRS